MPSLENQPSSGTGTGGGGGKIGVAGLSGGPGTAAEGPGAVDPGAHPDAPPPTHPARGRGPPRVAPRPAPPTRRAVAMLKAIADGRAELRCSCEPDLRVDGLSCCDQDPAHQLSRAGLVKPAYIVEPGNWAPA